MTEYYKILRIEDAIDALSNGQIGVESSIHSILGVRAWGGKDWHGNVTRFLALNRPGQLFTLNLSGPTTTTTTGILVHDEAGDITGGKMSIEEFNTYLTDGPIGGVLSIVEGANDPATGDLTFAGNGVEQTGVAEFTFTDTQYTGTSGISINVSNVISNTGVLSAVVGVATPATGALTFDGSGVSQSGNTFTFTNTNTTYEAGDFSHGGLADLATAFPDHPYYLAVDGTRPLEGNWSLGGFNLSNAATVTPENVTATYGLSTIYGHEYTAGSYGILTRGTAPGGLVSDILVTEGAGIDVLSTLDGAASGIECRATGLTLRDKYLFDSTLWPADGAMPFAASTDEIDLIYNTGTPGAKSLCAALMLNSLSFPGMPGDPIRGPAELREGNGILLTRVESANAIQIDSINNAITYPADSITISSGGAVTGDVTSIRDINEAVYFTIVESPLIPGFSFYVEFVNVESFDVLTIRERYGYADDMHVQLYRWSDDTWVDQYVSVSADAFVTKGIPIPSSSVFIGTDADDGKVRVRFYRIGAGNPSHTFYLDYCALEMSSGGSALGLDINYRADFASSSNVISADTSPVGIVMSTNITGLAMTQLNAANTSELALIYNASTATGGDVCFLFQGEAGNGDNVLGHRALWTEESLSIGATNTLGTTDVNAYLNFRRWNETEVGWHQKALLKTVGGASSQYYSYLELDTYDDALFGAGIDMQSTGKVEIVSVAKSSLTLTTDAFLSTIGTMYFSIGTHAEFDDKPLQRIKNISFGPSADTAGGSGATINVDYSTGTPHQVDIITTDVTLVNIVRPSGHGGTCLLTITASGVDCAVGGFRDSVTGSSFITWTAGEGDPDLAPITIPAGKKAVIAINYSNVSGTPVAVGVFGLAV